MSVNDKMKAIADAIRAHTGGTDALTLDAMAEAIAGIQAGGGDILGCTVLSGELMPSEDITGDYEIVPYQDLPESNFLYKNTSAAFVLFAPHVSYGTNYVVGAISIPNSFFDNTGSSISTAGAIITDRSTATAGRLALAATDWGLKLHCTSSRILKAGVNYKWLVLVPNQETIL